MDTSFCIRRGFSDRTRGLWERAGSLEDLGLAFWMNYGEFLMGNVGELTLNVDFHDKTI